jgi:hypothetical protein
MNGTKEEQLQFDTVRAETWAKKKFLKWFSLGGKENTCSP